MAWYDSWGDLGSSLGNINWGGLLGTAAQGYGAYQQGQAAKSAASQIASSLGQSNETIQNMLNQVIAQNQGMLTARDQAMGQLKPLLGIGTPAEQQAAISGITGSAPYQSALNQALQAADMSGTVPGSAGLRSSNQAVARAQIAPALLQSEIDRRIGGLSGVAGLGNQTAGMLGQGSLATANQLGSNLAQAGVANAAGSLGNANAMGNIYGGLGGMLGGRF